jgi:hypothetical protein
MIKALSFALRQHPDKLSSLEKLVLIGLADMSNDDMVVNVLKYKIARFACLDVHELGNILKNLVDKGFIKEIENNTEAVDTSIVYRLIAI